MNDTQDYFKNQGSDDDLDDLLPEYNFDYGQAHPNRFSSQINKSITVELEPDIARVFKNSQAVNTALRAILSAIPKS